MQAYSNGHPAKGLANVSATVDAVNRALGEFMKLAASQSSLEKINKGVAAEIRKAAKGH